MKLTTGSGLYDTIDQVVNDGVRRGLGHLSAEDTELNGRTVRLGGRDLLNLGTASYMHLECNTVRRRPSSACARLPDPSSGACSATWAKVPRPSSTCRR